MGPIVLYCVIPKLLGESYMSKDGCNQCSCSRMEDGTLVGACTAMACVRNLCVANGVEYSDGMPKMIIDNYIYMPFGFMRIQIVVFV